MGKTVISVEHLSKQYDLGVIGTGTIRRDLNRWWALLRGNSDPYAIIGDADHGNRQGKSILALDDVSFTVEEGEVLGIIGRNGAGKSTLLKILSQVTAPSSGEVKIRGRIGALLEVGTGFHPELTGRENVYLNGAILGMTRGEVDRKFDEIVDFSGVEKFIDTPVKRYSSGMKVRLGFAVAAHLDPEILIVDEVLAVGDIQFQRKCLGKMGNIAKEGRTVLFVSHNLTSIQELTYKTILFESGNILKFSETSKVLSFFYDLFSNKSERSDFSIEREYFSIRDFCLIDNRENNSSWYNNPIVFDINLNSKFTSNSYYIALVIENSRGNALITSWVEGVLVEKGNSKISYKLDNHHLPPGSYFVNLSINEPRLGNNYFKHALSIELDELGYNHRRFSKQKDSMGTYIHPEIKVYYE